MSQFQECHTRQRNLADPSSPIRIWVLNLIGMCDMPNTYMYYICKHKCKKNVHIGIWRWNGIGMYMQLGPEDVSLLERCPHFRGWYVSKVPSY